MGSFQRASLHPLRYDRVVQNFLFLQVFLNRVDVEVRLSLDCYDVNIIQHRFNDSMEIIPNRLFICTSMQICVLGFTEGQIFLKLKLTYCLVLSRRFSNFLRMLPSILESVQFQNADIMKLRKFETINVTQQFQAKH